MVTVPDETDPTDEATEVAADSAPNIDPLTGEILNAPIGAEEPPVAEEAADLLPSGPGVPQPEPVVEEATDAEPAPVVEEAAEPAPVAEEAAEGEIAPADEVLDEDEFLEPEPEPVVSPYDRPGRWYVVHTQSGYENRVKQNLGVRAQNFDVEDRVLEIVIPMEDVDEFKNGQRVVVQKKMFPGYLLVRSRLDDKTWQVIRDTPGVTGFVGQAGKPVALRRREVEKFLMTEVATTEAPRRKRPSAVFDIGEIVRVKTGPFADFQGQIEEVNEDQMRLKVLVNIFGRETPVELDFSDVAKP